MKVLPVAVFRSFFGEEETCFSALFFAMDNLVCTHECKVGWGNPSGQIGERNF